MPRPEYLHLGWLGNGCPSESCVQFQSGLGIDDGAKLGLRGLFLGGAPLFKDAPLLDAASIVLWYQLTEIRVRGIIADQSGSQAFSRLKGLV
jgi:hypothetical protein